MCRHELDKFRVRVYYWGEHSSFGVFDDSMEYGGGLRDENRGENSYYGRSGWQVG